MEADVLGTNLLAVWLIQKLKLNNWAITNWINEDTPKTNRFIGAIAASLTAAGFSFDWQAGGMLIIGGITAANGVAFFWEIFRNYVFQHFGYKAILGRK